MRRRRDPATLTLSREWHGFEVGDYVGIGSSHGHVPAFKILEVRGREVVVQQVSWPPSWLLRSWRAVRRWRPSRDFWIGWFCASVLIGVVAMLTTAVIR